MDNDIKFDPLEKGVDRCGPAADESQPQGRLPWDDPGKGDVDDGITLEEEFQLKLLLEGEGDYFSTVWDDYTW
jgi:hypothetical protein